jgi:hypothetical protein
MSATVSVSTLAPGARVVVRDEEWLVRRVDALPHEGRAVHVTGLSELVRSHDAIFRTTLDDVEEMRPRPPVWSLTTRRSSAARGCTWKACSGAHRRPNRTSTSDRAG